MIYDFSGKKVLIVEDNQINLELMVIMLSSTNIEIHVAKDSDEFFKKINERNYDIVLMDIGLPGDIDGYDLIKYMHKNNIDIPIIIQSANPQCVHLYNDVNEDYVEKPINYNVLYRKMNHFLSKMII